MRVMEAKLLNGTAEQYQALDEAIRTAQFVRNKCLRYWSFQSICFPSEWGHDRCNGKGNWR